MSDNRLFVGVFPGGIVYADRGRQTYGDYERLAFLVFDTLELKWSKNECPGYLRSAILADASLIQARKGEDYPISACGQTVKLGKMAP